MLKGLVIRVGTRLRERFTKGSGLAGRVLASFLTFALAFGVSVSAYATEPNAASLLGGGPIIPRLKNLLPTLAFPKRLQLARMRVSIR